MINNKINVILRIKPTTDSIWGYNEINDELSYEKRNNNYTYKFEENIAIFLDKVNEINKTEEIYKTTIEGSIDKYMLEEDDILIFAYGQTSSGKTYTMTGSDNNPGIVECVVNKIQSQLFGKAELRLFEIYNEKVYDLADENKREISIYTDEKGDLIMRNNIVVTSKNSTETLNFFNKCIINRKTEKTELNGKSSRSHLVFQLSINSKRVTFVDLAGSEKLSTEDIKKAEGKFINTSLLAFGNVINAISQNKRPSFRDSKLTRILEIYLKKSSAIFGFCLINPEEKYLSESLLTLRFASKLANVDLNRPITSIQITLDEIINDYMIIT